MCSIDEITTSNVTCTWPLMRSSSARPRAAIVHRNQFDARHHLEQLAIKMRCASYAACSHVDLSGIGLGVGDKFANCCNRYRRMNFHHAARAPDACNLDDVADEIEFEIVVQCGVPGVRRRNFKQGVAVWWRPHDRLGGEIATTAWLIHDDELLTKAFRQPLRDQPCTSIEWAARCIADEQVHWPRWIAFLPGGAHHAQRRDSTRRQLKKSSTEKFHCILPVRCARSDVVNI